MTNRARIVMILGLVVGAMNPAILQASLIDQTSEDVTYKIHFRADEGSAPRWLVIGWDTNRPDLNWCFTPKDWAQLAAGHIAHPRHKTARCECGGKCELRN